MFTDFYIIDPKKWLFRGHGDVKSAIKRAEDYKAKNKTYEGAENHIEEFVNHKWYD